MHGGRSTTREIATEAVAIVSSYHKERFALSQSSKARSYELPAKLDNKRKPVLAAYGRAWTLRLVVPLWQRARV